MFGATFGRRGTAAVFIRLRAWAGEDLATVADPRPIYRPELDALRGIAVLLVILGHLYFPGIVGGGNTGVTIFFVLSGYLITSILRANRDLVRFYTRRARRLLPALLLWLAVMVLTGVVKPADTLPSLLYVANWSFSAGTLAPPLGHTWSLAVEEQFYLLWPLVLLLIRRPVALLLFVIAGGSVLGVLLPTNPIAFEFGRFGPIAWGCLLGLGITPRLPRPVIAVAISVIVYFVLAPPVGLIGNALYVFLAAAVYAVMSMLVQRDTGPLAIRPLIAIGRISYGLYLWHYPFVLVTWAVLYPGGVATPGRLDDLVWTVAALAATSACAIASWFLVERRFLTAGATRRPAVVLARTISTVPARTAGG